LKHAGIVLLLPVLVLLSRGARPAAAGGDTDALIHAFMQDYVSAFDEGTPLLLLKYDPKGSVFGGLVRSGWFDNVSRSVVELQDVTWIASGDDGTYALSFRKIQEDLLLDGRFTRGVAQMELEVLAADGQLTVLSHRTTLPAGAPAGYRSNDPRSWGDEHSSVERSLFGGLEYLREGDLKSAMDAIGLARDMVEKGNLPKFLMETAYFEATCHYFWGMLQMKNGGFAEAALALDRALQLHPEFPAALNLRADIHLADGENEKAVELWERSLSLYPAQPGVRSLASLLADAAASRKKARVDLLLSLVNLPPSQAVQILAPAVKKTPKDAQVVALLAEAYLASGDPEKALEALQASRLLTRDVHVTYLAARAQLLLQNPDAALELLDAVVKVDPGYRDAVPLMTLLQAGQGRFQEAMSVLAQAAQAGTESAGVVNALLGKYSLMSGRLLDAVGYIERAAGERIPASLRAEVADMSRLISHKGR
jgi:tetratricopeptide (TPR) repeat protein